MVINLLIYLLLINSDKIIMEQPQAKVTDVFKGLSPLELHRKWSEMTVPLMIFQIHFQKIEEDYITYRGKNWQKFPKLKTLIFIPGTGLIYHDKSLSDVVYPGLLSFLPEGHQIILLLHPLAPQHKFPAPILHLERTLSHLLQSSEHYLIDKENMVFGGFSGGGGFSVVLAIAFAKKNIFFRSVVSIGGVYDYTGEMRAREELKQWEQNQLKDQKFYGPHFISFVNDQYCNSTEELHDPRYSPYFTSLQDLSLLKNPVLIYGENDFMRRTIEGFKAKLTEAGVKFHDEMVKEDGHAILVFFKSKFAVLSEQVLQKMIAKKMEGLSQIASCIKGQFQ